MALAAVEQSIALAPACSEECFRRALADEFEAAHSYIMTELQALRLNMEQEFEALQGRWHREQDLLLRQIESLRSENEQLKENFQQEHKRCRGETDAWREQSLRLKTQMVEEGDRRMACISELKREISDLERRRARDSEPLVQEIERLTLENLELHREDEVHLDEIATLRRQREELLMEVRRLHPPRAEFLSRYDRGGVLSPAEGTSEPGEPADFAGAMPETVGWSGHPRAQSHRRSGQGQGYDES